MDPWVLKEEKREMKKMVEYMDRLEYVADAQYGIPTQCACGAPIFNETPPETKYTGDRDWLPGKRYFTCAKYENDGLHYRHPWVMAIQEEVQYLRRKVDEMAAEIATLKYCCAPSKRLDHV